MCLKFDNSNTLNHSFLANDEHLKILKQALTTWKKKRPTEIMNWERVMGGLAGVKGKDRGSQK